MKKIIFYTFFIFVVFPLLYFMYWLNNPIKISENDFLYNLKDGFSFSKVAYDLEKENIISKPKLLIFYAKFVGVTSNLKVGTYKFYQGITPSEIISKLRKGDTEKIKITVPEGLNIYQTAELLNQYFPTASKIKWLDLMFSKELIDYLDFDASIKNLEGFLFPETYIFDPNLAPKNIVKVFLTEFKKNVNTNMLEEAKKIGLKPLEYITLASIVEKETSVDSELQRVAGVYWNRLKIKMKLQADPTVIYGMWNRYKGNITKKDLLTPTPYNTYTNYGLPPGPIASPGKGALMATLSPISQDLYFVAKGDGSHVFSKNLRDHNNAVKNYLIFLRSKKSKE
ncbi:endolytic transglycosylase MltG [Spirobacillus cienkowskii]|jgi:UPF0755 protein|uniref:Endolytic murein transglycosylase n=1 Tax=Spirobacillus cienkowskii TaxID=495820 RepID=A0A369KW01_9BACT|nr:MAG: endolytic transglycosylase MltG [Spirobacillus cienkowskii]